MILYKDNRGIISRYIQEHMALYGRNCRYMQIITSFDIETSRLPDSEESIMYIWQFAIDNKFVLYGRCWEDFIDLLDEINTSLDSRDAYIIVYVHNLSYEFQYLRTLIPVSDALFSKPRKVIRFRSGRAEFRCSYFLSNMSLAAWTNKFHVKHAKLSGDEFDYSKVRYPWTDLTDNELAYCANDVLGLNECIAKQLELYSDTLSSVPLTNTGYVRRDARAAMWRIRPKELLCDEELYKLLRAAFRGGDTHANRYYVGKILDNVYSADEVSSYPSVQINCEYPMEPFRAVEASVANLEKYTIKYKYPVLTTITFFDIAQRDVYDGFPYIPLSKCIDICNPTIDNGRVLDSTYLTITLTDIDLQIIYDTYKWSRLIVHDLYISRYGSLPQSLKDVTLSYFYAKTSLKNVPGKELYYSKSKNQLNSIYGMMAQNPCKPEIIMDGLEYKFADTPVAELLAAYNKNAFLPYSWGVWTTAWARYRLHEGIKIAGYDAVYCDTDSIKSVGLVDYTDFNNSRIADCLQNKAFATDTSGKTHYLGTFEQEGKADRFITWGAKKYCTEVDGKIKVIVSGVSRKTSADELHKLGGLESFKPGLVFRDSGGSAIVYNDHELQRRIIDDRSIIVPSNCTIIPSEYSLGITSEYDQLLASLDLGGV